MSANSSPTYDLICSCTDGEAILAEPLVVSVSSGTIVSALLKAVFDQASQLSSIQAPKYMDHITLWKLKQPLPTAHPKESEIFQNVANKFDSSPSIIQQLSPHERLVDCWTLEEINKNSSRFIHLFAKFPKPTTGRRAAEPKAPVANLKELRRFTSHIFIRVNSGHTSSSAFREQHLSGQKYKSLSFPNNYVLLANNRNNSALLSSVNHVQQLANTIMQGTLKARNWPDLKTSVLSSKGEINLEKLHTALSNVFQKGSTVHDDDYVSYHLYFVRLWPWNDGKATESRVHAFLTYLFQRNISNIFPDLKGSRLEFKTGQSLNWTVVLLKEKENQKLTTGNDQGNEYKTWDPHPDFVMLVDRFPFLVVEICSDDDYESDKWRMLLYAAAILRTHDTFPKTGRAKEYKPMIVACYIRTGVASVYIVYLNEEQGNDTSDSRKLVKYTQDDYTLTTIAELYKFTRLLYLLAQHIISEHNGRPSSDLPPWQKMCKKVEECADGLGMKAASQTTKNRGKD